MDQGLSENYSCPTCRKPLFVGRSESDATTHTRAVSSDEQLARQLSSGLDRANAGVGAVGVFPDQNQNAPGDNAWRLDPSPSFFLLTSIYIACQTACSVAPSNLNSEML